MQTRNRFYNFFGIIKKIIVGFKIWLCQNIHQIFFTSIDIKTAKITNSGASGELQMFNMGGKGKFFASPSSLNSIEINALPLYDSKLETNTKNL